MLKKLPLFVCLLLFCIVTWLSLHPQKTNAQSTTSNFYYVATAVDVSNRESVFSNEVVAAVPTQGLHTVALTCTEATGTAVAFNFYRGTVSGGPYARENASPISTCAFTDTFSPPPAPVLAPPLVK